MKTTSIQAGEQAMQEPGSNLDIDTYWEYSDPALSEERFRAALSSAKGDLRLELLTQIARTFSLRGRFDDAHQLLDEVENQLPGAGHRPLVRYLLERGRTFNSSGDKEKARSFFIRGWEQAGPAGLEGHAVDAAHMIAITYSGSPEAIDWNQLGLAIARSSQDPKARGLIPAMLNNSAWDLHDLGRFAEALPMFEEAKSEWLARGLPEQIRIAKWSVARCLRSLGRKDEALATQRELENELTAAGSVDGYVFEEIAECLAAMGATDEARTYFEKAYEELGKDDWFVKNEAERLANLKLRAGRS
jgi:tetratricopeptide (TPR) repeat protein